MANAFAMKIFANKQISKFWFLFFFFFFPKSYPWVFLWHDPHSRVLSVSQDIIESHPGCFIIGSTRRISFSEFTLGITPGMEYVSNIQSTLQQWIQKNKASRA